MEAHKGSHIRGSIKWAVKKKPLRSCLGRKKNFHSVFPTIHRECECVGTLLDGCTHRPLPDPSHVLVYWIVRDTPGLLVLARNGLVQTEDSTKTLG